MKVLIRAYVEMMVDKIVEIDDNAISKEIEKQENVFVKEIDKKLENDKNVSGFEVTEVVSEKHWDGY